MHQNQNFIFGKPNPKKQPRVITDTMSRCLFISDASRCRNGGGKRGRGGGGLGEGSEINSEFIRQTMMGSLDN